MIDAFFSDVAVADCLVQIGPANQVLATEKDAAGCQKALEFFRDDNQLYFLGGVDPQRNRERAKDEHIKKKRYFYVDFDVRKQNPEITDQEIIDLAAWFRELVVGTPYENWRYIVYSGNGLHFYYFAEHALNITPEDRTIWKMGNLLFVRGLAKLMGVDLDEDCINLARIGRMPGSFNRKGEPKEVRIVDAQGKWYDLGLILITGKDEITKVEQENKWKMEEVKKAYPESGTVYDSIDKIPVHEIAVKLWGWTFDGKNFFSADGKQKACFVHKEKNALIGGGSDHIPGDATGYSPFELVKVVLNIGNSDVFSWFKNEYPHLREISLKEKEIRATSVAPRMAPTRSTDNGITSVFDELEKTTFAQLLLAKSGIMGLEDLDNNRFLIRGAATRIGAYSNIGKSKLAYFFVYCLLKGGYRGIIYSTEVTRPVVLANMAIIPTGFSFWDIIEKRVTLPESLRDVFKNLTIFDVTYTQNKLGEMERLLQENNTPENPIDFILIDFCQGVMPKQWAEGEYSQMTHYALEVQAIAQRHNVCLIDLSQISNEGVRDEYASVGMIPFKGSGHLYSSADIGIMLKRNKKDPNDHTMKFEIRKHKYLPPKDLTLDCDFARGTFKVFGAGFP